MVVVMEGEITSGKPLAEFMMARCDGGGYGEENHIR